MSLKNTCLDMNHIDYVNDSPQSNRISAIEPFLRELDGARPIDRYFLRSRSLLAYGTEVWLSEQNDLGRLMLLGLVSEAESYFRSILSSCLEVCPISQKAAGEKQVNLGGVIWHGANGFSRSAFEHMSFASKDDIRKGSQQFLDFRMEDSKFRSPLEEFEKICQLRHGIVHNAGVLPGRNAVQLGVKKYSKSLEIVVDFTRLQESAAVIDTLVVTLNRELFGEMCKRWALTWRQAPDWSDDLAHKLFYKIWNIFSSEEERRSRKGRSKINAKNCMYAVRTKYNLV